jgi:exodeoxyribonuclease VII large subunit
MDKGGTLPLDFSQKPAPAEPSPDRKALTVAELDRAIKGSLDHSFERPVLVEGEVTGARPAPNGHLYFCLKDEREDASIDVAMYKSNITPRARALLVDGARVRLRGKPTFWAPRGKLQLVVDRAEPAGRGALLEALEKLKEKLAAEGIFSTEQKRPLPLEPRIVGVVTSARGAVIHDIVKVAFRRGGARILLAAAQVQGQGAPDSIRRALAALQKITDVDVVILGRGGGSADELMTFNDEALVRAVAACRVPVVSAVGHEVDVTLADFAADARAATPSQAAEMVVPDRRAQRQLLLEKNARILRAMRLSLASAQQAKDDRVFRFQAALRRALATRTTALQGAAGKLALFHPRAVIGREHAELLRESHRLHAALSAALARRASTAGALAARLDAMSPLKVLGRGYAIATRADGRAVRAAGDVAPGDRVTVRVHEGSFDADVVDSAGVQGAHPHFLRSREKQP